MGRRIRLEHSQHSANAVLLLSYGKEITSLEATTCLGTMSQETSFEDSS